MNGTPTDLPAPELDGPSSIRGGWSWRKMVLLIAFALLVHVVLIFSFGTKKTAVPRAILNVPQLQLASRSDELVALENPALFALPNPRDFATAVWRSAPAVVLPSFNWTETPRWLPISRSDLGTIFGQFMHTNVFARSTLDFKSTPQFILPTSGMIPVLPASSRLQISESLTKRELISQPALPELPRNDVASPSRVRVLVDDAGNVISSILLPAGNAQESATSSDDADALALNLARNLRFKPAAQMTFGSVVFYWHTIPLISTNSQ